MQTSCHRCVPAGYEQGLGSRLSEEEESFGRRRAWAAVANAAVLGVMNIAVLLCCLLGEMLDGVQRLCFLINFAVLFLKIFLTGSIYRVVTSNQFR